MMIQTRGLPSRRSASGRAHSFSKVPPTPHNRKTGPDRSAAAASLICFSGFSFPRPFLKVAFVETSLRTWLKNKKRHDSIVIVRREAFALRLLVRVQLRAPESLSQVLRYDPRCYRIFTACSQVP